MSGPRVMVTMVEELPELGRNHRRGPGRRCLEVIQDGRRHRYAIPVDGPTVFEITIRRIAPGPEFDELWVEHGGEPMQVTPDGIKMLSTSELLSALRLDPNAEIYHGETGERLWLDTDRRLRMGDKPGKLVSTKAGEIPVRQ